MSGDDFRTRVVHAGLEPDPAWGSVIPAIHQSSTFAQRAVGEVVEDYDYSRAANPTRSALERALGDLEGGHGVGLLLGHGRHPRARSPPRASAGDHVVIPADLYGGTYRLVDKVLSALGPALHDGRPDRPRRPRRGGRRRHAPDLGRDAHQPAAQRRRRRRGRRAQAQRARRGRQHLRHAGQPAPARGRRRRRRALDHEVPRRALRRHRRRRDRARRRPARAGALRAEVDRRRARARSTASSCTVACARWPCACARTPRAPARCRSGCATPTAPTTCAGRASAAWSPSAIPTPSPSPRPTKLFTLAESLGGVESLIEVPQAMTHQTVEGSAAAVPADLSA